MVLVWVTGAQVLELVGNWWAGVGSWWAGVGAGGQVLELVGNWWAGVGAGGQELELMSRY